MPKTAVGLFENQTRVDNVVQDIEALGFPRNEIRVVEEPESFDVSGVMSFPQLDFEVDLTRALKKIGASDTDAQPFIEGLRRGGALIFATSPDETKVDTAAGVMNRNGAIAVEETTGEEPQLPHPVHESMTPTRDSPLVAGRIMQPGGGACFFIW